MRFTFGIHGAQSLLLAVCLLLTACPIFAQDKAKSQAVGPIWTFEEVQAQLQKYPKDVFLQYVALKLGQRDGFDATEMLGLNERTRREISAERRENVDLFNLFSGSLAVQESLQLDAMRPTSDFNRGAENPDAEASVSIEELTGPTVESHPWHEMLKGRKPKFSMLAKYVPADNYYIRFRSVSRLLEILDGGDLFAKHLYTQSDAAAFVRDTESRLRQQLAVETNELARPFYDLVVKEIAITGSDPFVNEGSDVTLLFRFEQDLVFKTQMDAYLKSAEKSVAGVTRTDEKWEGIPFVHLTSPNRDVHVFSAYPEKGLHVRSNSRTAFLRILRLIKGQSDESLMSLGSTEEFAYIRTLLPFDAPDEDGLIYLSDPFIRRLVGPAVKLTELRRLMCFNNLRMVGHAAAMFEAEHGHAPKSMDELQAASCLPDGFNKGRLKCSCGGEYALDSEGRHGVCSHHGHANSLIPCCEIEETEVTNFEADAYRQFVTEYSEYWRTFFDPIAIRVQATPERYRLETIVLPLINNSMYQSLAMTLGGEATPIVANVTSDAVISLSFRVAKQRLLEQSGWEPPEVAEAEAAEQASLPAVSITAQNRNQLKQMGLAMHNFHDVHNQFPAAFSKDEDDRPLLSWRVHILPYLEQAALYDEFHLDESWDSPHNKALIGKMPQVYRSPGAKGLKPGTTTYQTIAGENTTFPADGSGTKMHEILDGTSNTAMVIDAAEDVATIWTKPGDLEPDPEKVRTALKDRFGNGGLMLMADGSVQQLRDDLDDETIANLVTRNDGNPLPLFSVDTFEDSSLRDPFGLNSVMGGRITERDIYEMFAIGLGDTVGLHVCDSDPTFDVQLTSMLSDLFGNQWNRSNSMMNGESLWIGMAIASLTSPVYVSLSVADTDVVDRFLQKLDEGAAIEVRTHNDMGWFEFRKDFYAIPMGDTRVRSFVLSLGPIKWRFFYTRIGSNLCIASKLQTLEQLVAKDAAAARPEDPAIAATEGSPAHAQLTIHRQQWNRLLPSIRLSWDEGARKACLDNIGPLTSAVRVATASGKRELTPEEITTAAVSIYGGVHFCPCGGRYTRTEDGRMICSVHGDADHPSQPDTNAANGASLEMLNSFSEVRVMLTFLEDGLHAVLEIDRRKE